MAEEQVRFKITAESDLNKVIDDLNDLIKKQTQLGEENATHTRKMSENIKEHAKSYEPVSTALSGVKNMLLTAFSIDAIINITKEIFNLTAQWEKFETVLTVSLGSRTEAINSLTMLQTVADKSNFSITELVDSFIKFSGRDIKLSKDNVEKLSDVVNALGKDFGGLTEAILDINNTERWNELGIKAKTSGDQVSLTFKGVTLEVEKSEQGVLRAVTAFGTLNGVAGMTEQVGKTLSGQLSTLLDGLSSIGRNIGEALTPAFNGFLTASQSVVESIGKHLEQGGALSIVFSNLSTAIGTLWTAFLDITSPIKDLADLLLPNLNTQFGNADTGIKLFATAIQLIIVGPFQALSAAFSAIVEAAKAGGNAFLGVSSALDALGLAMKLDFSGAKQAWTDASTHFSDAGKNLTNMKDLFTQTNTDFETSLKKIWETQSQGVTKSVDDKKTLVQIENDKWTEQQTVMTKGSKDYETAYNAHKDALKVAQERDAAVAAENKRWNETKTKLTEGTGEYAKAYADHLLKLEQAEGTHKTNVVNAEKDKNKAKKEQAFFDATELAIMLKETQGKSLKDQLDLIDANMKLEINAINNHKDSRIKTEGEAQEAIKEIVKKAEEAKQQLIYDNRIKIEADYIKRVTKTVELETKLTLDVQSSEAQRLLNSQLSIEERMKIEVGKAEKIAELQKKEQEVIKETQQIEADSQKERIKTMIGFVGDMVPILGDFASFGMQVVDNIDLITGKSEEFYTKQAQDADVAMETAKIFYGETSTQYNEAKLKSAEANKSLEESHAKSAEASANMAMAIADLVKQVLGMVSDTLTSSMDGIIESLDKTSEAFDSFTDLSIEMNKNMIDDIMEDTTLSWEERTELLDEYYDKEKELLYGNERMQNELNTAKNSVELAKWQTEQQSSFINNLTKGPIGIIENWKLVLTWRQSQAEKETELARQQTIFEEQQAVARAEKHIASIKDQTTAKNDALEKELDAFKDATEAQIELAEDQRDDAISLAEDQRDQKIQLLKDELDAFKEAKQAEIDAARQAAEDLKIIAGESTDDQINNIELLDSRRNELLNAWIVREVAELENAKQRALQYAANEEEKANIISTYNKAIADKYVELEDAKLDKTKATKLATEQLKAEEKVTITKIETETTDKIKELKDQQRQKEEETATKIAQTQADTANAILKIQEASTTTINQLKDLIAQKDSSINSQMKANTDSMKQAIQQANYEIFEATKKITIAELQGEIAKLRAKRWFLNAGKVDSSIAAIESAIAQIQGASFGSNSIGNSSGAESDMGINESYQNAGVTAAEIARQAEEAKSRVDASLSQAQGAASEINRTLEEARTRSEEISSISTQPTNPNEFFNGTTWLDLNGRPPGRDTIPVMANEGERIVQTHLNEKLGRSVSNEDLVNTYLKFKEISQSAHVPDFSGLNFSLSPDQLGTAADLKGLEKEVRALTAVIKSKPELKINVDANRVSVAEISHGQQHIAYYDNIYKR